MHLPAPGAHPTRERRRTPDGGVRGARAGDDAREVAEGAAGAEQPARRSGSAGTQGAGPTPEGETRSDLLLNLSG
ncbi:hypothetical protein NUM3379_00240 [Kineococcus sp. NUM-3379]